jgi:predicted molibdopterin-dependent oxidoreductase YjgC
MLTPSYFSTCVQCGAIAIVCPRPIMFDKRWNGAALTQSCLPKHGANAPKEG